MVHS
jgi:hypothetical protein